MSFLSDYLTYASNNEAPRMFHVWSGYAALSAAVTRKCWLPFGVSAIYPNIFTLFVGDAGNGKSRAIYNFKALVSQVKPELLISGSLETPPGLWRFMTGDPDAKPKPIQSPVMENVVWPDGIRRPTHPIIIRANEFINFISMDDKGWISALNDIFDEDVYHYRTKTMGQDKVIGPYVVLIGGLTTDVAHDLQKQKIISTGLARRTIFQFGVRRYDDPHAILEQTSEEIAAFARCLEHLNRLRHTAGAFTWSDEVRGWWTRWYNAHNREVPKRPPQTRSWFASKPDQVLKLAMLESLSDSTNLVLETAHFETATHYLSVMERDLYRIFGGIGRNELASVAATMFDFIDGLKEPISRAQLKLRLFNVLDARNVQKEFDEALAHLLDSNKVQVYQLRAEHNGKTFVDNVIATPEVLRAWAARRGIAVEAPRVDAVQAELEKDSEPAIDPSPPQAEVPPNDPVLPPPIVAPPTTETEADRFPTLPPPAA